MQWAVSHDEILDEAYGSRNNQQAIEVALNHWFAAGLFCQKHRNAACASVDVHT